MVRHDETIFTFFEDRLIIISAIASEKSNSWKFGSEDRLQSPEKANSFIFSSSLSNSSKNSSAYDDLINYNV